MQPDTLHRYLAPSAFWGSLASRFGMPSDNFDLAQAILFHHCIKSEMRDQSPAGHTNGDPCAIRQVRVGLVVELDPRFSQPG